MLGKESIFVEFLKKTEAPIEKYLVKDLLDLMKDFYYVLDIHDGCNTNLKIFNYLFIDLKIYTMEDIADLVYVSDRTIRRFKKTTENIILTIIKTNRQYESLNELLKHHKIS